jgi:hypothetical protein
MERGLRGVAGARAMKKYAHVSIDTGELPSARDVAEGNDLATVIGRWQSIAFISFRDDCRFLKQMIAETDELRLWEKNVGGFKYTDRDEFLRQKVLIDYELTERDMTQIVGMLKRDDVDGVQKKLGHHGGDRRSAEYQVTNSHLNKLGPDTAERIVRRLKRDSPEIAAALARGEYRSARAAGIAAGFVKVPTALDRLHRAWAAASAPERGEFLAAIGAGKQTRRR